jgi:PhnB protein
MNTRLNPYLGFRDTAGEAMAYYQSIRRRAHLNTFGEFHASDDPAENDKIMHSMLTTRTVWC